MKKILITLLLVFGIPFVVYAKEASVNTSYDSKKCVLEVSGSQTGHDASVSLFNKDGELIGFKTGEIQDGDYSVSFVLTNDVATKIDITVANEAGNNEVSKTDVDIPVCKISGLPNNKTLELFDKDNSIVVNNIKYAFNVSDFLMVHLYDMEQAEALLESLKGKEEYDAVKKTFDGVLDYLKDYKVFVQYIDVFVRDRFDHDIDYSNYKDGFVLNLAVPKDAYEELTGLKFAYVIEDNKLSDPLDYSYDEEHEIIAIHISEPRAIVAYLDNDYVYLDKTGDQTYSLKEGDTLTIRINALFSKFKNVYVDEKLVDSSNYEVKSGSTIITFKKEFMQSLSVGEHTIRVNFEDGSAVTTVNIVPKLNPKTEDVIMTYIAIIMLSGLGIGGSVLYFKKRKNN